MFPRNFGNIRLAVLEISKKNIPSRNFHLYGLRNRYSLNNSFNPLPAFFFLFSSIVIFYFRRAEKNQRTKILILLSTSDLTIQGEEGTSSWYKGQIFNVFEQFHNLYFDKQSVFIDGLLKIN
jgi:hypothetical protein